MLNRSLIWCVIRCGWMPPQNLYFKVIFRVIKVNEVILSENGVFMRSEGHNFGKRWSNSTKSLCISQY